MRKIFRKEKPPLTPFVRTGEVKMQVAAPEGGIIFDIGHEKTDWQQFSDSFRSLTRPRLFYATHAWDTSQKIPRRVMIRPPYKRPQLSEVATASE